MKARLGATTMKLVQGDITHQQVDAIVNAANAFLAGGSGVDGAIHRVGGTTLNEACQQIIAERGLCPTGQAVLTTAGQLRARKVIHAVGPVWGEDTEAACDDLLASAYRSSLELAFANGLRVVAFPSLSTGAFGFPVARAAPIALRTIRDFVLESPLAEVRMVLFDATTFDVYQNALQQLLKEAQHPLEAEQD